jgi:hypothetical protein
MATRLRIPSALAFTVVAAVGAAGAAVVATAASCGGDSKPAVDASSCVICVYEAADTGACPYPTCATGSNHDMCPAGCIPQPAG